MVAKFTADYFSKDGIYESKYRLVVWRVSRKVDKRSISSIAWINLRNYPFLNNKAEYRRDDVLVKHVMTKWNELTCLTDEGWTISHLGESLQVPRIVGLEGDNFETPQRIFWTSKITAASRSYVAHPIESCSGTSVALSSSLPSVSRFCLARSRGTSSRRHVSQDKSGTAKR